MIDINDMSFDEIENMIDDIVDSDEFDEISKDFFASLISNDDPEFSFSKQETVTQLNENYDFIQTNNKMQSEGLNDNLISAA